MQICAPFQKQMCYKKTNKISIIKPQIFHNEECSFLLTKKERQSQFAQNPSKIVEWQSQTHRLDLLLFGIPHHSKLLTTHNIENVMLIILVKVVVSGIGR